MRYNCDDCLNSRSVLSETGVHPVCCLSREKAADCITDKKSWFVDDFGLHGFCDSGERKDGVE